MGLLVSLALSCGMTIGEITGTFTPPHPGPHDSPIPPEDFLKGSGAYPPQGTDHLGSPQTRGGYPLPNYDYQPIPFDYPQLPERSNSALRLPDMSQGPTLPPAEESTWHPWCLKCNNTNFKGDRGDRGLPGDHSTHILRCFLFFSDTLFLE